MFAEGNRLDFPSTGPYQGSLSSQLLWNIDSLISERAEKTVFHLLKMYQEVMILGLFSLEEQKP